jgi:hypothetical protein
MSSDSLGITDPGTSSPRDTASYELRHLVVGEAQLRQYLRRMLAQKWGASIDGCGCFRKFHGKA